jgi:uncharacterized Zn-finger protein|tara:strand:+ start:884 stop:1054 length:171 start_codon:yes stop_codon:yes gene_type:complete
MEESQNNKFEIISKDTENIKCDGGEGDLGHPAVYFKMTNEKEISCNYCNKKFIKES